MRRKVREIADISKIYDIISKCHCCRVGFNDDGEVYIVPLNFGFVSSDEGDTFYFHGAGEGRKINLIEKIPVWDLSLIRTINYTKQTLPAVILHGFKA